MRIKRNIKYLKCQSALLILMLFAVACDDHGIEPQPPESSGFSGTVRFLSEWPDSIKRSFIIVFKDPLLADSDFVVYNIKFLSREIPIGVPLYEFSSLDSSYIPITPRPFPSGSYAYVAVVQQSTEEISLARKDWFVSGVYYTPGDTSKPGTMVIPDSTFVRNINIFVDFNNPPPQPPGYN